MEYEKIKAQFGSWAPWLRELIESKTFDDLYEFLKAQKPAGRVVIPASGDTWKSLTLCPKDSVRCVILLQCPYTIQREMAGKGKVTISNGVPMDCSNIAPYQQPSLYQWWQAIEAQYGFNPDHDLRCDISYLLEEEGVLLLNTSLTVELNKVDSHQTQWHDTMKWFCENVINKYLNGVPIVMCGTQAQKFEKYLNPMANPLLSVEHMAAASYTNRDWKHMNLHKWVNEHIRNCNGPGAQVRWTRNKGEGKQELPEWLTEKTVHVKNKELPSAQELGLPWNDNE